MEWTEVNLAFSWGDIEWDDDNPEQKCFRDDYETKRGMFLDCLTSKGREGILIGDVNQSTGYCGCCNIRILFVYRFTQLDIPTLEGRKDDE